MMKNKLSSAIERFRNQRAAAKKTLAYIKNSNMYSDEYKEQVKQEQQQILIVVKILAIPPV